MDPQNQTTSLQRLQNVEKNSEGIRACRWSIGGNREPSGPRKEIVNRHCSEFMQLAKDILMMLREEIKSTCNNHPFEKCDSQGYQTRFVARN